MIVGLILSSVRLGKIKVVGICLPLKKESPRQMLNVIEPCEICPHIPNIPL